MSSAHLPWNFSVCLVRLLCLEKVFMHCMHCMVLQKAKEGVAMAKCIEPEVSDHSWSIPACWLLAACCWICCLLLAGGLTDSRGSQKARAHRQQGLTESKGSQKARAHRKQTHSECWLPAVGSAWSKTSPETHTHTPNKPRITPWRPTWIPSGAKDPHGSPQEPKTVFFGSPQEPKTQNGSPQEPKTVFFGSPQEQQAQKHVKVRFAKGP